jgi:hypothetical protein
MPRGSEEKRAPGSKAPLTLAGLEAAALTNHLLGTATAIEVHVIADRLTLVHRSVMPAVLAPGVDRQTIAVATPRTRR